MNNKFTTLTFITLLLVTNNLSAALYDRGDGFIYDDDLDITWLQDANYANTSNANLSYSLGRMTHADAVAWTDSLNLAGGSNWRLPSAGENPSMGYSSADELGHMFFNNLGNSGSFANSTFIDGETGLTVSFENVQNFYWLNEEINGNKAWSFYMAMGFMMDNNNINNKLYTWAVHDGDIANSVDLAAVPVPASALLFGSALLGLMVTRRQANQ